MKDDYYLCHSCNKDTARKDFAVFSEKWDMLPMKCTRIRICKKCKGTKK